jgi:hypothetical protein
MNTDLTSDMFQISQQSPEEIAAKPLLPRTFAAHVETPKPTTAVGRLEQLVRDSDAFLLSLDQDKSDDLPGLLRALIGAVIVGAGLFGAILGAHRGGMQILACALKIPMILLITLVVCAPPFVALVRVANLSISSRRVIALALGSCARFALVLVGLAPFIWLMEGWSLGYHRVILSVVGVCVVAGISAGKLLFAGLARAGNTGARVGLAFVALFALVGAQTSWILRPFVVRPQTQHVPFVRSLEGDFLEAVSMSARSALKYNGRMYSRECEGGSCE